jgi:hypothetical protein
MLHEAANKLLGPVFFLSRRNLHPGPMHDSKFWKEYHLLAPTVGFSHSEKTLLQMFLPLLGIPLRVLHTMAIGLRGPCTNSPQEDKVEVH